MFLDGQLVLPGRVVANFGPRLLVEDVKGNQHPCAPFGKKLQISCGDYVYWNPPQQDGDGYVVRVLPRFSQFQRADKRHPLGVVTLAANVDQVIAVAAPRPPINPFTVDRCLAAAIQMHTEVQQNMQADEHVAIQPDTDLAKSKRKMATSNRNLQAGIESGPDEYLVDEDPDDPSKPGTLRSTKEDERADERWLEQLEREQELEKMGVEGTDMGRLKIPMRRNKDLARKYLGRQPTAVLRPARAAAVPGTLAGPESAVIVFNKIDMLPELDEEERRQMRATIDDWRKIGYKVLEVSALEKRGLEELKEVLKKPREDGAPRVSILLGQSGTGKSTLLNALVPGLGVATRELAKNEHGKHTTTTVKLYHLPFGGAIIDSPGIQQYAPVAVGENEAVNGYIEIREAAVNCKFRNCKHDAEPHCAVKAGVEAGTISERRYRSYIRLLDILREYKNYRY